MDNRLPLTLEETIAAVQGWWREAGVDLAFHDEPAAWLAGEEPVPDSADTSPPLLASRTPEPPSAPQRSAIGGDRAGWPRDLEAFREWWLAEPSLDEGGSHPRIAPRGPVDASLMMLVPMPEIEDQDALLSGSHGRLLTSLALAMGLAPGQLYLAAALPRHSSLPDWDHLAASGAGEILRHHISLANPTRLIVFGSRVLPLLGHDPAQAAPAVSEIDIHGRQIPLLATFAPERLLGNARQRAGLWQRWLEWTDRDA